MSKKARQESIESECGWAGEIRWFAEIIGDGEASYYDVKTRMEEQKKLDNFRCAHPDVPESEAKRIVRGMRESAAPTKSTKGVASSNASGNVLKELQALKSKLGQVMKESNNGRAAGADGDATNGDSEDGNRRNKRKSKFAC